MSEVPSATRTHGGEKHAPSSKTDLFVSFTLLALQGFGGVLAVVQRELVEKKKWLTVDEFVEDWSVAQILPGPNVVNLALMIGGRAFGLPGALSALAGLLLAPLVLVLMIAAAVAGVADTPTAQGMLRGMGAVSAGLIAAVGIKLIAALKNNPMGQLSSLAIGGLAFIAIALFRLPLAWVLLSLGPLASVWASHCIAKRGEA
jgi:chromate transporter